MSFGFKCFRDLPCTRNRIRATAICLNTIQLDSVGLVHRCDTNIHSFDTVEPSALINLKHRASILVVALLRSNKILKSRTPFWVR